MLLFVKENFFLNGLWLLIFFEFCQRAYSISPYRNPLYVFWGQLGVHIFQILIVLAIAIAMAPPLAPPKGFKFRKFFSRSDPNIASTSQVPPSIVVVPPTDDDSVQPVTPLGERKKII
jgi:hypothetical protein